jgi:predicted  nucleic acid-binding Zn-ribbon protein
LLFSDLRNGNANRDLTIQAKDREIVECGVKLRDAQAEVEANSRALADLECQLESTKDQMSKLKMKVMFF